MSRVDFDDYTESYDSLMKEGLGFFEKDEGYFSRYKIEIMRKSEDGGEDLTLTKAQALSKLTTLHQEGKINLMDVTKLEDRIQKGHPIPAQFQELFKATG